MVEGFKHNENNNLTLEASTALRDGKISKKEAVFMLNILDTYGRKNVEINHDTLIKLANKFGLNYKNLTKIGPKLYNKIKERAQLDVKYISKKNISKLKQNISLKSTMIYYNYNLVKLTNSGYHKFVGKSKKIEHKALLSTDRIKIFNYINKYLTMLNGKEKESFLNILFFESLYGKYKSNDGLNKNGTTDIGPCAINDGDTLNELIQARIVKNRNDLYNWDNNFKAAAFLFKKYGKTKAFKKWYGRIPAKKAGLYNI